MDVCSCVYGCVYVSLGLCLCVSCVLCTVLYCVYCTSLHVRETVRHRCLARKVRAERSGGKGGRPSLGWMANNEFWCLVCSMLSSVRITHTHTRLSMCSFLLYMYIRYYPSHLLRRRPPRLQTKSYKHDIVHYHIIQ